MSAEPHLRVLADGLIHLAEERPRKSDSARLLRDAAASILDADEALEREGVAIPGRAA